MSWWGGGGGYMTEKRVTDSISVAKICMHLTST